MATGYFTDEVDDPVLDELAAQQVLFATMGGEEGDEAAADLPWDVEVAPPVAVDLRKVYAAAPESGRWLTDALSQSGTVVLVRHAITAFGHPGERPPPIGRMDYKFTPLGMPDAVTCSWAPDTTSVTAAHGRSQIKVGLGAGGKLGVIETLAGAIWPAVAAALHVLAIPDLEFRASGEADFVFAFDFAVRALKVEAGETGVGGGVRWQLYRKGEDLIGTQTLLHTMTVPPGVERVRVRIEPTIVRKRSLLRGTKAQKFTPDPVEHDIPIR
jgi:hypothetical protein